SFPCDPPPLHLLSFPTRRSSDLGHVFQWQPDPLELVPQELNPVPVTQDVDDVKPLALLHKPLRYVGGSDAVPIDDREQPLFGPRSEEHTSELQSRENLVCRLLLE